VIRTFLLTLFKSSCVPERLLPELKLPTATYGIMTTLDDDDDDLRIDGTENFSE